jgi:outer membrane protein assembly factor BamB
LNIIALGEATASYSTPVIRGDFAYITGYNNGKVYKINISAGGTPASVFVNPERPQGIVAGIAVEGDRVYTASSDGRVYALNANSLDRVWNFATGDKIWSTPAVVDGIVYAGSFDKKVYAINADNGQERWSFATEGAVVATPLVSGGLVYIASLDRHIYALNAQNGSLVWQFPAESAQTVPQSWFWARPVIAGSGLYAPNTDGKVYVLDAESGTAIGAPIDVGSSITSSPVVTEGRVVFVNEIGEIYTVNITTNKLEGAPFLLRTSAPTEVPITANSNIVTRAEVTAFNNRVYLHTINPERVFEYELATGQAREIGAGPSAITAIPSTTGGATVTVTNTVTVTTAG